jgi:RimJ/RimL family protein N-acetyltransferase
LIRSVSLNPLFQGKGITKKAFNKISEFANENFPEYNELVLTVNFRNENAHQLYLKINFINEVKKKQKRTATYFKQEN